MRALVFGVLAMSACSSGGSLVYVANEKSGDIMVIDASGKDTIAGFIPVGKRPHSLSLTADGRLLFVTTTGSPLPAPGEDVAKGTRDAAADGVVVVDTETRKVLRTLPVGRDPQGVAVSADGKRLLVASFDAGEVVAMDLVSLAVVRLRIGPRPRSIALRPDGAIAYVASQGKLGVIDVRSLSELAAMAAVGLAPAVVVFSADGKLAFVGERDGRRVAILDAVQHAVVGSVELGQTYLVGMALSADGKTLLVTTGAGGSVIMIDVGTRHVTKVIEDVGGYTAGIGITADGKKVYVANIAANDVAVLAGDTGKLIRRVPAGKWPMAVLVGAR